MHNFATRLVKNIISTGQVVVAEKVTDVMKAAEQLLSHVVEKSVVIDKFVIPYFEGGHGETIVLIHGFQANKETWLRFARHLTHTYHVVAIDLPAHGDSNIVASLNYGILKQSERVLAIMDALKLTQPVHLVGHSMGGAIAFHMAALQLHRVKSLTLIASSGIFPLHPSELFTREASGENPLIVNNIEEYQSMLAFVMHKVPYIPLPIISTFARKAISRAKIAAKIYSEIFNPRFSLTPEESLTQIHIPTLIMWGDQDRAVNISNVSEFERLLPMSETVVLKNVGHIPQVERAKEASLIYKKFLDTL